MPQSKVTLGFSEVVRLTTGTIDIRARRYRNLVILFVILTVTCVAWAAIRKSWRPAVCLFFFVPACAVFFYLDGRLITKWQEKVLGAWVEGNLDLAILRDTLNSVRALPRRMLQGMLDNLPPKDVDLKNLSPSDRRILAATLQAIGRCQTDRTGLATLAYVTTCTSVATAAFQWSWLPLLGSLLVLPLIAASHGMTTWRLQRLRNDLASMKQADGSGSERFLEVAARLDWGPIPREKWQKALTR